MNAEGNIEFLFDISTAIKHFYETPVIFLTKKDYSDNIFNTMCTIRSALQEDDKNKVIDSIVDFHLQWLYSVNELQAFMKRIHGISKQEIYEAISFTIDCMGHRFKYFNRYSDKYRSSLNNEHQLQTNADIEIIEEMHKHITNILLDKLKCFRDFTGQDEFELKVSQAVEELLNWIDKINDDLAILLSKHIHVHLPQLKRDLTKTLQQIVDELQTSKSPSSQVLIDQLRTKGKELSSMIRSTTDHNLEISKVLEKIEILDSRIKRLEDEPFSAALMALQNKKEYLEKRLASLENLKITLKSFHRLTEVPLEEVDEEELCVCEDFYQLKIFNHMLPVIERERLVTELCRLWDLAVFGERSQKSIISILSAADMKEEFTDEFGTFYIDEYSRKIYKLPNDDSLYQLNESNELVPLSDDSDYVYFYDECGRYFIDPSTRQRIYKAHANASEYLMDSSGMLIKSKEERDGITYYYDNYGRYYINEEGKHIYRDIDTTSEYENDDLGNLVRIRSQLDLFQPCPGDANVTEEFKYLRQSVGVALRKCIAEVILYQPADPIKFLSTSLTKFRENLELKDKRAAEKEELNIEREIRFAEERAAAERAAMEAALLAQGGSEASYDSNLMNYTSLHPVDGGSVIASSK